MYHGGARKPLMTDLTLYIGNKNYSSWSLRPWFAMRASGIHFHEELVPFDMAAGNPAFSAFSPTNKVPVLKHGQFNLWESLAIIEYLNELFPKKGLWPSDRRARAHARAISCEMLSGFFGLRAQCPMNMRRVPSSINLSVETRRDIKRIEQIWKNCLERYGGPFLFGDLCAADAMFAPVVNRFEVYCLSGNPAVKSYMQAMQSHPAWQEWERAGRAEKWVVEEDEV